MSRRQKWGANEDEVLAAVILALGKDQLVSEDWETVSAQMRIRGLHKTAKQCRERFFHEMAPPPKSRLVPREVEQRTKSQVVRAPPQVRPPLEGHRFPLRRPHRQRNKKSVFFDHPEVPPQGVQVLRTGDLPFDNQLHKTQNLVPVLQLGDPGGSAYLGRVTTATEDIGTGV